MLKAFMVDEVITKWAVMMLSMNAEIMLLTGDCCISIRAFLYKNMRLIFTSKANLKNALKNVQNGFNSKLMPVQ